MKNKLSVTIIEDDFIAAVNLRQLIEKENFLVKNIYKSGEEYLKAIHQDNTDIVLIDVDLDGKVSGIDIGKELKTKYPDRYLIFVTGKFDNATISDILKLNPACYIRKPYDETTLLVNLNLVVSKINNDLLINSPKITIQDGIKSYTIVKSELLFMKSDGNYVEFHLKDKDMFFVRKKLNDLNDMEVFDSFIRTHSRFLVNPKHIFHYSYRSLIVGKTEIPISEKNRSKLRKIFS